MNAAVLCCVYYSYLAYVVNRTTEGTMQIAITVLLIVVGIIHLLPLSGVLSADHLSALYGLSFQEPNLEILMRHRAILFGLLGSFLIYAAFKPPLQPLAFVAGFISVLSFIGLAWLVGGYNGAIRTVVVADIAAVGCLLLGTLLYLLGYRQS